MTVAELIEHLKTLPPELHVRVEGTIRIDKEATGTEIQIGWRESINYKKPGLLLLSPTPAFVDLLLTV
jgi:hypothetical protein